ncbi:hypothetical protein H9L17_12560 [Thermomonas brevis]|uniref:Uncharacterized protein n=1 Tax=Thermomonas brevis TaxID=215691 RepID=A0A7G9QRN6_9GAMM|nr:hypothetical protein [Thermomonas brevis]QNN46011.1 hypothetical protein H9L17_12560 [Thermomonas brevis]
MREGRRQAVAARGIGRMDKRFVYPFFGIHMLMFGLSGFFMAYSSSRPDLLFIYMHGGIAIVVYLAFYLAIFGRDEVKWMLINAALGILGIYSQVGWLLARFGKRIDDYPWYVHVTPFLYYMLYTFLLRQFLIDVTRSRDNPARRALVNNAYVAVSLLVYLGTLWRLRPG